jgi:hypothetical protein
MIDVALAVTWDSINRLKSRGWVLLEEVLSSRRLVFGKQMKWLCTAGAACETHPVPKEAPSPMTHWIGNKLKKLRVWLFAPDMMQGARHMSSSLRSNHFDAWYAMVEKYRSRNLTLFTDNLPALSGLVSADSITFDTYIYTHLRGLPSFVLHTYTIQPIQTVTPSSTFAQGHGATYLAGLWREDLQIGLAWYIALNQCRRDLA